MVDVKNKQCGEEGCSKRPLFGSAGGGQAEFCATHALAGIVDVRTNRCGNEGCSKQPSFGAADGGKAEFCATHARAGMVDFTSKRCGEEGCSEHPSFGTPGDEKAAFCTTQAPADIGAIGREQCVKEGCSKRPLFRSAVGGQAELCATHAPAGIVEVEWKRCGEEECSKHPLFGAAGGGRAEVCATHTLAGMVDMGAKRRGKDGRSQQPSIGTAGGRKAEFWAPHTRAGMVHVENKRCGKKDCSKQASCGAAGGEMMELCTIHVQAGMGHQCTSQCCVNRVREYEKLWAHAAHELVMSCDAAGHVHENKHLRDDLAVGKTAVGIDRRGERRSYISNAGPNANDCCRDTNDSLSSRAIRSRRRLENLRAPPTALGPPSDAAPIDSVPSDRAEARMKLELETTIALACVSKGVTSSGQLFTAQPSSCGSMGNGDSRGAAMKVSYGSGIATGRNTKRLRWTAQVEPVFDVAAEDDLMVDEDRAGVKLELGVSASSGYVSSSLFRSRET
ncbi:unnamed protein product [Sphacelaria rigidula]